MTVTPTTLTIEEGNQDTYEVVLNTRPSQDVTVTIHDPANTEVTAEPASRTFTPSNWHVAKTVTVTAGHDSDGIDEAATTITHTVSSTFEQYDGLKAADVSVTITDDDEPGVSISRASLEIEEGNQDTYEVELDTEPAGDVTVTIGGTTGTDLRLDKDSLDLQRTELGPAAEGDSNCGARQRRGGRRAGHPDPHRQLGGG